MKNLLFLTILLLFGCNKDDNQAQTDWLIPFDEVLDGGPGKDGIPSVDAPQFDNVSDISFLNDNDLVIGMFHNGVSKAYPHQILDWHEIVNDDLSDISYALTYCPLTGTGIAWDRVIDGSKTSFGVSGKLYNTNLMPYDRATDSYWSQIRLDCVNGTQINKVINTYPIIETTWSTWKAAYPNSEVMNLTTGSNRNYGSYPYGDYRTNHSNIIFPVSNTDDRLPAKERALIVMGDQTKKVYSIELFAEDRAIEDTIDGTTIIVIGSKSKNFIVAYEKGNLTEVVAVTDQLPTIATDTNGNRINLDGTIESGPLQDVQLTTFNSFIGYFFALGAFYEVEIYE